MMEFTVNYKINNQIKIFESISDLSKFIGIFWKENTENLPGEKFYSIALSGGNTPLKIFQFLSKDFNETIEWNKIHFFWGDERCVPPTDNDSNYKLAKDFLLDNININAQNIFRIKGEVDPKEEAESYSNTLIKNLATENSLPKFDFVMLGLGEDGHTASIFPNQIDLFHSTNYCEVAEHPTSGQKRITITGSIINNSDTVAFVVVGKSKAARVFEIMNNKESSNQYPASLVCPRNGKLFWLLDKKSASMI